MKNVIHNRVIAFYRLKTLIILTQSEVVGLVLEHSTSYLILPIINDLLTPLTHLCTWGQSDTLRTMGETVARLQGMARRIHFHLKVLHSPYFNKNWKYLCFFSVFRQVSTDYLCGQCREVSTDYLCGMQFNFNGISVFKS
jgi:hypothetical protein